jgi:hypothetical protein
LAALHGQRLQLPGNRRSDIDKFAFDITLEAIRWRIAATAGEEK